MASGATHREIEVKLPVRDLLGLVHKLGRLPAMPEGRVFEQNTLYDTSDSDLRRQGLLLRLRTETPARSAFSPPGPRRAILTAKTPAPRTSRRKPKYKERLERERVIARPLRQPGILRSLGFRPGFQYEKYRTTFRFPGLQLDLDETPVGLFLELEGTPQVIDRVAGILGYSPQDYFRGTYWDIYAADCRRRGRTAKNMVFDRKKIRK